MRAIFFIIFLFSSMNALGWVRIGYYYFYSADELVGPGNVVGLESVKADSSGRYVLTKKNLCPSRYEGGYLESMTEFGGVFTNAAMVNGEIYGQWPPVRPTGAGISSDGVSMSVSEPPFPATGATITLTGITKPTLYFYQMTCYYRACGDGYSLCQWNAPSYWIALNMGDTEKLDLAVNSAAGYMVTPSNIEADGKFSVKSDVPTNISISVTGKGFDIQESRSATVTLSVGDKIYTRTIAVNQIKQNGAIEVKFDHVFKTDDVGKIKIVSTVSASDDSNAANNSFSDDIYLLCNVEDKETTVPFFSQAQIPWGDDAYGNTANSSSPGTIAMYGCSITDFAMLMRSYGINSTPLGSPLNPAVNGVSTIAGLKGEVINPGNLNLAFVNYKTKFTGKASVAYNNKNNPIWEGMAEVARAGYRAQCAKAGSTCDPSSDKNAISLKSILMTGFDNSENSAHHKKVMKELCAGNPVIMKFKSLRGIGQHYMLAKGITVDNAGLTYRLNDPGSARGQNVLYSVLRDNYPSILGYTIYRPSADPSMLGITAPLNIHFVVVDPLGRRTGYDPATKVTYNEIPGASYGDQVINTSEEDGQTFEVHTAERYFLSPEGNPEGNFKFHVYGLSGGSYYLDSRSTDSDGYSNGHNYRIGSLAAGQSEVVTINHSHVKVTDSLNANLKISNYVLSLLSPGLVDVGLVFGGKITAKNSPGKISLSSKFELIVGGVGGFKILIPANKFKKVSALGVDIYSYSSNGVKVILTSKGKFEVFIKKANLSTIGRSNAGKIQISIDSLISEANLKLKCYKNICVGEQT